MDALDEAHHKVLTEEVTRHQFNRNTSILLHQIADVKCKIHDIMRDLERLNTDARVLRLEKQFQR